MSPHYHVRLKQLDKGGISVIPLKIDHGSDISHFLNDVRIQAIPTTMHPGDNIFRFLPTLISCKPTWGLRKEHQANYQEDSRNHLQAPWKSESDFSGKVGTPERNVKHDHDTPCNSPLLATNETSTNIGTGNFGNVDRDLSRADPDRETVDKTAHNEHADVLRSTDNDRSNTPIFYVNLESKTNNVLHDDPKTTS